ncbi:2-hydroxychromene-2-carboxylate isomerase [Roseiarcus fermentans]|uniref:2-hydroxychromene-2-carboxylate isomerase n=1 Tax=Roseiarcus fermentans TaxID=1473586 RepID=A0A366FT20_9HYPH|nr:2-hydroxychromene-2-carboxylate isomerase [Roseiarcus fermentans]
MVDIPVKVYFNFRSPYCYLASKRMFDVLLAPDIQVLWRPLGGWNGRSSPERASYKLPITRQDVARWCRRMNIGFVPPPSTTDPTNAALGSLEAERLGVLQPYIVEVMREEWEFGHDIGQLEFLVRAAQRAGLSPDDLNAAIQNPENLTKLEENAKAAESDGAFGVPTFVVGAEVFWGNDRLDFLTEHLDALRENVRR